MGNLDVLIVGGSVTGGGGVEHRHELAWPAALDDFHPTVQFKSAIDPSYFLQCTRRFVDHSYDVVLFDLGANMRAPGSSTTLVELIRRMRCLANASAVGVVAWPGRVDLSSTLWAAQEARATVIEVPYEPDLYASDGVHPNARGHALITERVHAYLVSLNTSARAKPPASPQNCLEHAFERCYPRAPEMPVVRDVTGEPRGWKLVDDSPIPDRLHKYGWASDESRVPLTMVVPTSDTCGAIVSVAYLASNATGPFRLACEAGCVCSPILKNFQALLYPFPIVTGHESWLNVAKMHNIDTNSTRNPSLKVTRDTTFQVLRERRAPCRVTAMPITDERVRIDAFYVREPDAAYATFVSHSLQATPAQRWFGMHARTRGHCDNVR